MRKRQRLILSAVLLLTVVAWSLALAGCQPAGTGATTQPSAITVTTDAEASLTAAVSAIDIGVNLKIIPGATYLKDIAPIIHAGQASLKAMRDALNAGKTVDASVAENTVLAAVAQLQPYVAQVSAATK